MKKKSRWIVAVGLALALVLSLAPTQALAADVPVTPNGPYSVPAGGTCTITVDIGAVTGFAIAQFEVLYDAAILSYTGYTLGDFWSDCVDDMEEIVSPLSGPDRINVYLECKAATCETFPPPPHPVGIDGSGDMIHLEFDVIGVGCDACDIEMSPSTFNNLFDGCGVDIAASWGDTTLEVTPCEPFEPVVVSGKHDGTEPPPLPPLPYCDWAVEGNDWGWDPAVGPPGFVEDDQFKYCEWVWVWGSGFEESQTYKIWIQAYGEGTSVVEGQVLLATEPPCPPVFPPDGTAPPPVPEPGGWVPGWVEVHIDADGTFGPVPVWHVPDPGLYCTWWEIVADKQGAGYGDPDTYNAEWDGLDAIATDVGGFHIYPEGLTIILVALGLVAVGGYLVVRRRRGVETDLDL